MLGSVEHTAFTVLREILASKIGKEDCFLITDVYERVSCGKHSKGFSLQTTDGRFCLNLEDDGTFNIGDFHWAEGLVDY